MGMVNASHQQFDIYLAALDPTLGREIQKTRPCVIITPNVMNDHLQTVVIAPMTTKGFDAPFRVPISFKQKHGLIVCDHLRSVDKRRLVKRLGKLDKNYHKKLLETLVHIFSESV